jgi:WS/DGAT/MGAT family acyltransferase
MPALGSTLYGAAKQALAARRAKAEQAEQPKRGTRWKLAPPTPFNASITNQRAFAGVSLPLDDVKRTGKAHGASINDMVLWLCSTALRGYLKDARELPEKSLVAAVPVSLRAEGDTSMNNQVSGSTVDLGTQIADPLERLRAIMVGTAAMKREMGVLRNVIPTDFPSVGAPWLISGIASLYGRSRLADRMRIANVTISNVPGPQMPVYLAGAKMLDYFPVSIVVHGVALNITVQSYMGQLCFGLIACRRAVPDVNELGAHLRLVLETLTRLELPESAAALAAHKPRIAPKTVSPKPAAKPVRRVRKPKLAVVAAAPAAKPLKQRPATGARQRRA